VTLASGNHCLGFSKVINFANAQADNEKNTWSHATLGSNCVTLEAVLTVTGLHTLQALFTKYCQVHIFL
jgi:hypothetical protein